MVRMRFERNVRSPAARAFQGLLKSDCLRVLYTVKDVKAFTDNLRRRIDYHTPHQGARAYLTNSLRGELQSQRH
jgi:hypothetical protein